MISLDSETTGTNLYHSARPFFVTVCDDSGNLLWWEWRVDPLTRLPEIPPEDLAHIQSVVDSADSIATQNSKFDVTALKAADENFVWPWDKTEDCLTAGHVLASNQPHTLTDMVLQYLEENIEPYEIRLGDACREARQVIKSARKRVAGASAPKNGKKSKKSKTLFEDIEKAAHQDEELAQWLIAEEHLDGFPSIKKSSTGKGEKDKNWKNDLWLPRELAIYFKYPIPDIRCDHEWNDWTCTKCEGHRWHIILSEYSNIDSTYTLLLWQPLQAELHRRDLWEIYKHKLSLNEIAADMEKHGVTMHRPELLEQRRVYVEQVAKAAETCVAIAKKLDYDLILPKSGTNHSLKHFCFGRPIVDPEGRIVDTEHFLKLPVLNWTDGGEPSLDSKVAIPEYLRTLDGEPLRFIKNLARKRKRDTFIGYLDGYERYWQPLEERDWLRLHANENPNGTYTLRWSHNDPNLANISKQEIKCEECKGEGCAECGHTGLDLSSIRKCFGPAPGREWWSCDFENIELRLPAYLSGEKELIALFEEPDKPPFFGSQHLLNFSIVYPEIWEVELVEQTKHKEHIKTKYKSTYYQWVKNGDFAIQYQAGDKTADATFRREGAKKALRSHFVRLDKLNEDTVKFANRHGYVETIPDRTINPKHGYPLLCTRSERGQIVPTVPLSYKIQGSAMHDTNKAMIACHGQISDWRKQKFYSWITLQCHDELVFDLPKRADPRIDPKRSNLGRMKVLQRLMAAGGEDFLPAIPTPTGLEYHPENWSKGISFR